MVGDITLNKKILIIVTFCLVLFFIFAIIPYFKEFLMSFRQGDSLNYQAEDVVYVEIRSAGRLIKNIDNFKIDDPKKIEKIMAYIDSLEVIELNSSIGLSGGTSDWGWILIYVERSNQNPGDIIEFMRSYMVISYNSRDWESKKYYVKNSGFNPITTNSKAYQFLYDLINE